MPPTRFGRINTQNLMSEDSGITMAGSEFNGEGNRRANPRISHVTSPPQKAIPRFQKKKETAVREWVDMLEPQVPTHSYSLRSEINSRESIRCLRYRIIGGPPRPAQESLNEHKDEEQFPLISSPPLPPPHLADWAGFNPPSVQSSNAICASNAATRKKQPSKPVNHAQRKLEVLYRVQPKLALNKLTVVDTNNSSKEKKPKVSKVMEKKDGKFISSVDKAPGASDGKPSFPTGIITRSKAKALKIKV